jgi:ABC-2 type transport system permease protein
MRSRLIAVVRKETREVLRDPIYLGLAIVVPIVVTALLALGFVLDVKHLPVAFYDQDRSPLSRDYIYAFTNSEYFRLVKLADSAADIDRLLESAEVRAAVVIPPGFARRLHGGDEATVQVLIDGTFPGRALIASGYIRWRSTRSSRRRCARRFSSVRGWCGRRSCPSRSKAASGTTRRSRRRTRSCRG